MRFDELDFQPYMEGATRRPCCSMIDTEQIERLLVTADRLPRPQWEELAALVTRDSMIGAARLEA